MDIVDSDLVVVGDGHYLPVYRQGGMEVMGQAEYMREYRKTPAGVHGVERQKRRGRAREKALRRLASLHEGEFIDLFNEELRAEGL